MSVNETLAFEFVVVFGCKHCIKKCKRLLITHGCKYVLQDDTFYVNSKGMGIIELYFKKSSVCGGYS